MARRGFFAELNRQAKIAESVRARRQREAARQHAAAIRHLEQTQRAEERARSQLAKAKAAELKRLEKEAKEAHLAAREAEVEERNQALAETYAEIDGLLEETLLHDDHVDLETLRREVKHPAFDRDDLEVPAPPPEPISNPPQPIHQPPDPPRGLASLFGKKKHAEAVETEHQRYHLAVSEWEAQCRLIAIRRGEAQEQHARAEEKRLEKLQKERERYAQECRKREDEVAESNRRLDELIVNLGYGTTEAVQEYVAIVLGNSVYPDQFPITHEFAFNASTAELDLKVAIPPPEAIPTEKTYKYAKATDEIVSTLLPQKDCRDRYASAVQQVALRSFHEIFEADRRGLIRTIALEVGTTAIDPATGRHGYTPFVIASAERGSFLSFDLSAVVPAMTLASLGAAVSKSPYTLVPADRAGVRRA